MIVTNWNKWYYVFRVLQNGTLKGEYGKDKKNNSRH